MSGNAKSFLSRETRELHIFHDYVIRISEADLKYQNVHVQNHVGVFIKNYIGILIQFFALWVKLIHLFFKAILIRFRKKN